MVGCVVEWNEVWDSPKHPGHLVKSNVKTWTPSQRNGTFQRHGKASRGERERLTLVVGLGGLDIRVSVRYEWKSRMYEVRRKVWSNITVPLLAVSNNRRHTKTYVLFKDWSLSWDSANKLMKARIRKKTPQFVQISVSFPVETKQQPVQWQVVFRVWLLWSLCSCSR